MVADADNSHTGGCHCGQVTYSVQGLSDIWYCHCTQCRRMTGHYVAAGGAPADQVVISGELNWYAVSQVSRFGACQKCGSFLFWRNSARDTISILAGSLDNAAGVEVKGHIYTESKGDYYEIDDGLPQYQGYPEGGTRN